MLRMTRSFSVVLACLLVCSGLARAQELAADDILPENTLLAVVIPDLAAARAQAGKSRLGDTLSQPEMQAFLQPILKELRTQFDIARKGNPMIPALEDLDAGLLSGELALAACAMPENANSKESIVIMIRPKDMAAFQRLVPPPILGVLQAGQPLPLGPVNLAMTKDRLLFCTDAGDLKTLLSTLQKGAAGGTLSKLPEFAAAKAAFPDAAGYIYGAPPRFMNSFHRELRDVDHNRNADGIKKTMQALGMESTLSVFSALTFRNGIPVLEGTLRLKNKSAEGIFGLFTPPAEFSPQAESFGIAAANAPYVSSGYVNLAQILPLARQCLQAVLPAQAGQFDQIFQTTMQRILQCDIQKDLLENIGPDVVAVQTPTDTGSAFSYFPGMVFSFSAKDPARIETALKNIGAFLGTLPPEIGKQYSFNTVTLGGNRAYFIEGMLMPATPIFCVYKNRVLMGTSINALRRVLEQTAAPANILSNTDFQQTLARVTGKPFDAAHLPGVFTYAIDEDGGGAALLLMGSYIATTGGATSALAELPGPEKPPAPAANKFRDNPVMEFIMRPAGQVILPIACAVDLNLWPDETFFSKRHQSQGSFMLVEPNAVMWRTELPPPGPRNGTFGATGMTSAVAVVAVIAAIAIPSLLRSRMAANQTAAMAHCKAYAEAQEVYHRTDYNKDGVLEYAQSMQELYGPNGNPGLVDQNFAGAEAGPAVVPKAGYIFKVLKAQGDGAVGGKKSFILNGHMTLGYALLAYPAQYDGTGRVSYMISHNGTIYEADMGEQTEQIAGQMTEFNPKQEGVPWVPSE